MHALDQAGVGEFLEVAADGVLRHREIQRRLDGSDATILFDTLQEQALPLGRYEAGVEKVGDFHGGREIR